MTKAKQLQLQISCYDEDMHTKCSLKL